MANARSVISVPIHLLWNFRIPWKQKLALLGIFCLIVVVIVISIVRTTVISTSSGIDKDVEVFVWANVEMTISEPNLNEVTAS